MYFNLDYIYDANWRNYHFLRIPKLLFEDARFLCVSFDARMFFSFLIDRISLSIKNGWADDMGRVYIFYTLKEAMSKTRYGHNKMSHIFAELESIGLIERVRQGQGKPIRIYVKDFCALMDGAVPVPRSTIPPRSQGDRTAAGELDGQLSLQPEPPHLPAADMAEDARLAEPTETAEKPEPVPSMPPYAEPVPGVPVQTHSAAAVQDLSPDMAEETPAVTLSYGPVLTAVETLAEPPLDRTPPVREDVENVEKCGKFSTFVENSDVPAAPPAPFYPPEDPQTSANGQSRLPLFGSPDCPKSEPNKTKKNKTDFSETDPSNPPTPTDRSRRTRRGDWWKARMDEIERCKRKVRFQIDYDRLEETHSFDMNQVDDYVDLIVDVMTSRKDYLYVSRENRPIEQVRRQFEKLDYEHITYILDCMRNCATDVTNVRAYMLSTLFNAPVTIRAYYEAKVRHDMAQDDWWDNWPRKRESWAS